MKKVLSVLVILGFVIGMAACSNKKAEEEARIADSLEQVRINDSIAQVEAEAAAAAAAEAEAAAAAEAEAMATAEAETAAPTAKKTTVQKAAEVVQEVKEAPVTKKRRGGGTSGN